MKSSHQLLQALVACSLASLALHAAADAADAVDHWVLYRVSNGLPVDPKPSLPGELPTFAGPVPDAPITPLDAEREKALGYGNGNGAGHGRCEFFVELARSDGDTRGQDVSCD